MIICYKETLCTEFQIQIINTTITTHSYCVCTCVRVVSGHLKSALIKFQVNTAVLLTTVTMLNVHSIPSTPSSCINEALYPLSNISPCPSHSQAPAFMSPTSVDSTCK